MGLIQNVKEKLLPTEEQKAEHREKELQRIEMETKHLEAKNALKTAEVETLEKRKKQQDLARDLKERQRKASPYYEPKQTLKRGAVNVAKSVAASSKSSRRSNSFGLYAKPKPTKPKSRKSRKTSGTKSQTPRTSLSNFGSIGFNGDLYTGGSSSKSKQRRAEPRKDGFIRFF